MSDLSTSPQATPRMFSISARVTGWRYATMASVSRAARLKRFEARCPWYEASTPASWGLAIIRNPEATVSIVKARPVVSYASLSSLAASRT